MFIYLDLCFVYFQDKCQNYIRVLGKSNGTYYVCGTNAFEPKCRLYRYQEADWPVSVTASGAPNLVHQSLCTKACAPNLVHQKPCASKTSCTKPLAPKLKHLVPKLVHQTSCTKARTTNLLHQTLCTKPCATNLVHQTLCIKPCAPNLMLPLRKYSTVACVKRPLSKLFFKTNYHLMQDKSIAECSKGSILQYFWPSLSYQLSLRSLFCLLLSGRFTQVLLYLQKKFENNVMNYLYLNYVFDSLFSKCFEQSPCADLEINKKCSVLRGPIPCIHNTLSIWSSGRLSL